jgi:hypothetical protein
MNSIPIISSWGDSDTTMSDYRLGDQVLSPAEANFSSSLFVQNVSKAHPASCAMGTWGPFPRVKRGLV